MTFYIRTGEHITQPFTIPLWAKIFAVAFACYFVWITVEYFKVFFIEAEIAQLQENDSDKYEMIELLDTLTHEIQKSNDNADLLIETLKKEIPNELATNN